MQIFGLIGVIHTLLELVHCFPFMVSVVVVVCILETMVFSYFSLVHGTSSGNYYYDVMCGGRNVLTRGLHTRPFQSS